MLRGQPRPIALDMLQQSIAVSIKVQSEISKLITVENMHVNHVMDVGCGNIKVLDITYVTP